MASRSAYRRGKITMARKAKGQQALTEQSAGVKSDTATKKPTEVAKTEPVALGMKVEVTFASINDLKQVLGFTSDGDFEMAIQFKAKVDPFEVFRLINLLKQPHAPLYAIIGSPQTAMDFMFDKANNKVEVLRALKVAVQEAKKLDEKAKTPASDIKPKAIEFVNLSVNHLPTEAQPFGLFVDYKNGNGEDKSVAGRGQSPAEAGMSVVRALECVPLTVKEPFEVLDALRTFPPTIALAKLILTIARNKFEYPPDVELRQAAILPEPAVATAGKSEAEGKRGSKKKTEGT